MMDWCDVVRVVFLMSCLVSAKDWCDVGSDHTMCQMTKPSSECTAKTIVRGLSAGAADAVLNKHNELRRKVAKGNQAGQPKAANMRKMVYSEDLAIVAQRWADQCTFGHDGNRKRCDGTYVGQNVFWNGWWSSGRSIDNGALEDATQAWYDEVTDPGWTYGDGTPFTMNMANSGCGHYTQVVWAESDELGCGAVQYDGDDGWKHNLVVCNYAVGGNFIDKSMYEEGAPASNCPAGFSPDDGLCSKDSAYATEECDGNGDAGTGGGGKPLGGKGKKPAKGKKGKGKKPKKGKKGKGKKPTKGKKPKPTKCPECPVC